MYSLTSLPNGVKLVMVPIEGVESVSVAVFVACGGRYERSEFSGVSHFLEHMVFKGTRSFPSYTQVHMIEELGGIQNAYTGNDVTKYYAKVLARDWEKTLEVVADLALHPLLPEKDFESERRVIFEEMAMYEDDLPDKSQEVFDNMMYVDNPLGRRIIGSQESLLRVDREVMWSFHQEMYRACDLVVAIAGKIKDKKGVESKILELFGGLEGKNLGFEKFDSMEIPSRVRVVRKNEANQANLVLGARICGRHDEDRFALQVFNLLFGVGFTSRLFRKIREEKGLCYSIGSSLSLYDEVGDWSISAGLNSGQLEEAVGAITDEVEMAWDKGVGESEMEVAKTRVESSMAFRMENIEALGEFYGRQVLFGQKVMSLKEYLERIKQVNTGDVMRVIKKYFDKDNFLLSVVGKVDVEEERLASLLRERS